MAAESPSTGECSNVVQTSYALPNQNGDRQSPDSALALILLLPFMREIPETSHFAVGCGAPLPGGPAQSSLDTIR
jgi:hypothetical protein